jgi:hypothetical protein
MKLLENVNTGKLEAVSEGQCLCGFRASDVKPFLNCFPLMWTQRTYADTSTHHEIIEKRQNGKI